MDKQELKRKKYQERINKMCLMDDNLMSAVLQNKECCELVINTILDRNDIVVIDCKTQYTVSNLHGRSVRLDVLARNEKGEYINIEVQQADEGAFPKRAHYNSSLIDANVTETGDDLKELPETYVIFITSNDVLGYGLPLYEIERTIKQNGRSFSDGSHIIYVNASITNDTALGILMHDFKCRSTDNMYIKVLADTTKAAKEGTGDKNMCKIFEELLKEEVEEAVAEAVAETRKENSIETAIRLIGMKVLSPEQIAEASTLSLEKVNELISCYGK